MTRLLSLLTYATPFSKEELARMRKEDLARRKAAASVEEVD